MCFPGKGLSFGVEFFSVRFCSLLEWWENQVKKREREEKMREISRGFHFLYLSGPFVDRNLSKFGGGWKGEGKKHC